MRIYQHNLITPNTCYTHPLQVNPSTKPRYSGLTVEDIAVRQAKRLLTHTYPTKDVILSALESISESLNQQYGSNRQRSTQKATSIGSGPNVSSSRTLDLAQQIIQPEKQQGKEVPTNEGAARNIKLLEQMLLSVLIIESFIPRAPKQAKQLAQRLEALLPNLLKNENHNPLNEVISRETDPTTRNAALLKWLQGIQLKSGDRPDVVDAINEKLEQLKTHCRQQLPNFAERAEAIATQTMRQDAETRAAYLLKALIYEISGYPQDNPKEVAPYIAVNRIISTLMPLTLTHPETADADIPVQPLLSYERAHLRTASSLLLDKVSQMQQYSPFAPLLHVLYHYADDQPYDPQTNQSLHYNGFMEAFGLPGS